jgi:Tfp pilus assembly protein PilF
MRCGPFALATLLSLLSSSAFASQSVNRTDVNVVRENPIQLAELREESIGQQDLASPEPAASPGAAASPAAATNTPGSNSNSDDWKQVPAGSAASDDDDVPASNAAAVPAAVASPAAPAEIAPAIDAGSIATTPNVSDASLQPLIDTAPTPARAASLRITERQRVEMERGHTDDAVRELAHAISIDPSNSYAYFYLGRAYIARRDYVQAETFFKRAEIGVASNPAWLGETYAFEGVSLEQEGKSADAVAAYQKALTASPGNLTARVGVTRLSAFMPAATTASAPQTNLDQPAPAEPGPPTAPDEAPAPPPPASAPPPSD